MSEAPERIYATINGRRTRIILGGETGGYLPALIGGWCEQPDKAGEVEYVRADLIVALEKQITSLKDTKAGLIRLTKAQAHMLDAEEKRADKAEAEVARLREALELTAEQALYDEIPPYNAEAIGDKDEYQRGYDAAIRVARAALGDASAQQTPAALNTGGAT